MRREKLLFILMFILTNVCSNAQNEQIFNSQIKLVEDFMKRFNCEIFQPYIDITKGDCKEKNMLSIFDSQIFGIKNGTDTRYQAAQELISDILATNTKINFEDTAWVAIASCYGKFKGNPVEFTLILNVENYDKKMYKWTIAKAVGDIFKLTPSVVNSDIIITPIAHELNFMQLHDITDQKKDCILNYRQKRYNLDETAVFYSYIYTGMLDIEYVSDLQFKFFQVPNWVFTIKKFNRLDANAGWLITDFQKTSQADKEKVLHDIYYNYKLQPKTTIIEYRDTCMQTQQNSLHQTPKQSKQVTIDNFSFEMVYVQGDKFQGENLCDVLNDYVISNTELSIGLWNAVMDTTKTNDNYMIEDNLPVVKKSKRKYNQFLEKLNEKTKLPFRFATSIEYEFAIQKGVITRINAKQNKGMKNIPYLVLENEQWEKLY